MRFKVLTVNETQPDISRQMGMFGINKELPPRSCNHVGPCASPLLKQGRRSFYHRGEEEVGNYHQVFTPVVFHDHLGCESSPFWPFYLTLNEVSLY